MVAAIQYLLFFFFAAGISQYISSIAHLNKPAVVPSGKTTAG